MERFGDWNPVDYSEWCIGPGLVDGSVTANPQWESLEELSKTALAGGVTTLVVQSSLHSPVTLDTDTLYCDLGKLKIISSVEDCHRDSPWTELAWKTYLFAPSALVEGSREELEDILEVCGDMPLVIEPSLPSSRLLFLASPYRLCSLEERANGENISDEGLVAAALPDDISPASSYSSEDDSAHLVPTKTTSNREQVIEAEAKPTHEISQGVPSVVPIRPCKRRSMTLMEGVLRKVKGCQSDITLLSAMEQSAYDRAGPTFYGCNSASTTTSENSFPPPAAGELNLGSNSMFRERMQRFRPSLLVTAKPKVVQPSKEADYQLHLANCPEQWELNGVNFVLSLLADYPYVRVHFAQLASAAAVSAILQSERKLQVSCETPAHCLCFCMEEIAEGDTRYKVFPALRNKTNLNLLWELLKLEAIDQVNSAHSSIPAEFKPSSFRRALSGINSLGATLPAIWSRLQVSSIRSREHYAVRLFKWMSLNPAKFLNLPNKGKIAPGAQADLVVWAPNERFIYHSQSSHASMSPYEGQSLHGRVRKVYLRGHLAYDEGQFVAKGQLLSR